MLNFQGPDSVKALQKQHLDDDPNKIPMMFMMDVIHGCRTIYPVPLGLSASFDPQLVKDCCAMAAKEAAAEGINVTFAPMADLSLIHILRRKKYYLQECFMKKRIVCLVFAVIFSLAFVLGCTPKEEIVPNNPSMPAEGPSAMSDRDLVTYEAEKLSLIHILAIMIIVTIWGSMGVGFLAMIAGVLNIDSELYEAAYIDGVKNRFQEIVHVTIPSMKPQMLFGAVMAVVGTFSAGSIGVQLSGANPTPRYACLLYTSRCV